MFSMLSIKR